MSIVRMKKLGLMAVSSQREELLRDLMLLGCVEISEPRAAPEDELLPKLTRQDAGALQALRASQGEIRAALKLLDGYAPSKNKLLAPLPDVGLEELLSERALPAQLALARKIIGLDDRNRRLTAEESRLRAEIESLMPWTGLDLPLGMTGTETCAVQTASLPTSLAPDAAEAALRDATENAQLYFISADKSQRYVLLICMRQDLDSALTALRPLGYAAMTPGDVKGTAKEGIASAEERLRVCAKEKLNCSAAIAAEGDKRPALKLCVDTLSTKISRAENAEKLLCTESVSIFWGWVPEEKLPELAAALEKYDCAWETEDPSPEEYPEVPIKLKNNRFSRPLNMVTEMYSLPAYDGVDPNPLMAPFFILFYGIMMADMAYGLIMMLAGLLVLKLKRPKGGAKTFCELLFVCGISTFIWGIITGGFFGDAPLQLAVMLNPDTTFKGLPALFNPIDNSVYVLIGAMGLGLIQIVTGMMISFINKLKNGEILDAIFEEFTWWVVFAGIGCMALKVTNIVLWIGVAMVFAGPIITGKGLGKITGIFASLYNHVTGFFGDILSYSRLMALMLAGSVIAQVFNTLGAFTGKIWFFIPIFLVGHSLNFALNLLGCYVHDLRLQCLEYFGKFYKDGGRAFKPLDINTKYYNLVK
ncbi:MAG: V-type ATP synthase subunit I [Oscillospiraceae bacterium]